MNSDCGDNMCSEKANTGGERAVRGGLARARVPTPVAQELCGLRLGALTVGTPVYTDTSSVMI